MPEGGFSQKEGVADILRQLSDPDPHVRYLAAWTLESMVPRNRGEQWFVDLVLPALMQMLPKERFQMAHAHASKALAEFGVACFTAVY